MLSACEFAAATRGAEGLRRALFASCWPIAVADAFFAMNRCAVLCGSDNSLSTPYPKEQARGQCATRTALEAGQRLADSDRISPRATK